VGFPVAAYVAGWVMERTSLQVGAAAVAASVIGGIGVLYAFGIPGMAWALGKTLPEAGVLAVAFLPGDVLKCVLAGVITAALAGLRPGTVLSRT
jgi:biotin transport system substrate-specific component